MTGQMTGHRSIMTVDAGNTAVKVAVFEDEYMVHSVTGKVNVSEAMDAVLAYNSVDGICYCCVGHEDPDLSVYLAATGLPFVRLDADTPVPIAVEYDSRATLGVDRLAAAVGVSVERAALVVDAGTAVTSDLVVARRFIGGNISPGLRLRFRSLNAFTSRLPLVGPEGELPLFGHDTVTAIRSGVVRGLVGELVSVYESSRRVYDNIKMILTGGDASVLYPLLEEAGVDVVADPEIVGRGLVRIFNYNDKI